jgi:hypothetical protein
MTDIEIPFGDNNTDNAVLLLAAAEELKQDASVVRTSDSAFIVPEDIAKKAGLKGEKVEEDSASEEPKPAAKKASAKKK